MKNILVILSFMLTLFSCTSSDGDLQENGPDKGSYIGRTGSYVISVVLEHSVTMLTVFKDGKYTYQSRGTNYDTSNYPVVKLSFGNVDATATFSNASTFVLSSVSPELPTSCVLSRDDTVLDANKDGIID